MPKNRREPKATTRQTAGPGGKMPGWRGVVGLGVLIAIVFWPSLKIPFLLDDYQIYLDHWPEVSWSAFARDVGSHFQQNRILTHVSWYLQMLLASPEPPAPYAFHWLNLVLHWINAVLVLVFARTMGASDAVALFTAALFAVHPSNMEAVSYIYGRSDMQVTFFLLAGLIPLKIFPRRWFWAAACLAAAVLTKETAVVAPALYVMIAGVLRPREYPFRTAAFAMCVAAALAAGAGFLFLKTDHADNFGYDVPDACRYLLLQPVCLFAGLIRMIVPFGYYITYQFDLPRSVLDARVIGALLFWAALGYACYRQWRRGRPVYLFALGWYLAAMAPTNSVVPRIDQLSDRHLYPALIGPILALATAIESAWLKYGTGIRNLSWAAVVLIGALTFHQNMEWQSAVRIWEAAATRFPEWPLARRELATEYGRSDQPAKELELLESLTQRWPHDWTAWNTLGIAYAGRGMRANEQQAFLNAIAHAPRRNQPLLHHNLALSYQSDQLIDSAIAAYRRALSIDPAWAGSKHNLAILEQIKSR